MSSKRIYIYKDSGSAQHFSKAMCMPVHCTVLFVTKSNLDISKLKFFSNLHVLLDISK